MVIGAALLAFSWNILLGYGSEFPWSACFVFASIACATDPVAVVALLKELGTPIKFNILLEGESLLNDGTAMVFYLVFASIYKAQGVTLLGIIWQFIQLSIGGPIIGAVACFFSIIWLRRIVKDEILTISLTFFTCYLTFFIGESYLGVSGILAIVTLGVLMGAYGRVKINPESEHAMHSVWSFIQFVLETLIFIITGCFIGKAIILAGSESLITGADWIKMFIFFFLMTLARYIMVSLMYPFLNKTGYPVTRKDLIVLTYGGLRGAIALSLALMVAVDEEFPLRFRELVLFYLVGMITLTIMVNGMSIKYLMEKIDFTPVNNWKVKVLQTLNKDIIIKSVEKEESLKHNKFLKLVDWKNVNERSGINEAVIKASNEKDPLQELRDLNAEGGDLDYAAMNNEDAMSETRLRFYKLLKAQIWERFEESICGGDIVNALNDFIDLCIDELNKKIWIWEAVSDGFMTPDQLNNMIDWKDTVLIGKWARNHVVSHLLETYEKLNVLILSFNE